MSGKIFINYRRGDDPGNTGRLFDRLQETFRRDRLFMDVDSIAPGHDFVKVLEEQVSQCDVLLAVIGRSWIDARDAAGARRLDDANDFVRIEIESALKQNKLVIPVLVGGANMPSTSDLPDDLKPFALRNAVRLTHERFRADTQGLVRALQKTLAENEGAQHAQASAGKSRRSLKLAIGIAVAGITAALAIVRLAPPASIAPSPLAAPPQASPAAQPAATPPRTATPAPSPAAPEPAALPRPAIPPPESLSTRDLPPQGAPVVEPPQGAPADEPPRGAPAALPPQQAQDMGPPQDAPEPESDDYHDCGQATGTIAQCSRAIAEGNYRGQRLARLYYNRGKDYRQNNDIDRAIADLTTALDLDPRYEDAYYLRCVTRYEKRDYDGAVADCTKAIEIDPRNAVAYYGRGISWKGKRDLDRAITDYTTAIGLDPKYRFAYDARCQARYEKHDDDGAIADCTTAISLDPKDIVGYVRRGRLWQARRQFDRAIADFSKAIELGDRSARTYYNRGLAKQAKGDKAGGRADIATARQIDPNIGK